MCVDALITCSIQYISELELVEGTLQSEEFDVGKTATHVKFVVDSGFDHFISVHKVNIDGNAVRG